MKQLVGSLIESLKSQPIGLALVVVNIAILVLFALTLREGSRSIERRDRMVSEMLERCVINRSNGERSK